MGGQVRTSLVGKGADDSAYLIHGRTVSRREAEYEYFGCHDVFDDQIRFGLFTNFDSNDAYLVKINIHLIRNGKL